MAPGQYSADPKRHTLQPIVTGATVVGMKYAGGVLLAADTMASYGSQARYKDVCRLKKVGNYTLLGASGEISDFQYIGDLLDELDMTDFLQEDGCHMGPQEYASYIGRVMYNRRSKMNPLYNQLIVAGKKASGDSHLAFIDHQGTAFEEEFISTGFGAYLAMPILRNEWKPDISLEDAKKLAIKCLQVCFYRDCNAYFKIHVATCDGETQEISEPIAMDHYWGHSAWLKKSLEGGTLGVNESW
mmetsp:Transcript_38884/g.111242  ORF Transcript_38884/g.111242 Transcript_38884/m.111242 type:complete len:243 (-) Transcript_38884:10-738(-)